jgi:NAD(P)-dependent dehydrogenase (short-subunit alcohol dehydrogenase family)
MQALKGKVAVVAGATRGSGRGIACMLGAAGATVYCTGRSARGRPASQGPYAGRLETIEETAKMVCENGGKGIPVRTDHTVAKQVAGLFQRAVVNRSDLISSSMSFGAARPSPIGASSGSTRWKRGANSSAQPGLTS